MGLARETASSGVRARPALFRALGRAEPPPLIAVAGQPYSRIDVLKHDSWAATALYHGPTGPIICKFNRSQSVFGLPMSWLGSRLAHREAKALHDLADLSHIPNPCGPVEVAGMVWPNAVAHVFIPGHPFAAHECVSDDFFPQLARLLAELHRRGLAYVDLHKRENILVGDDGRPYLIDFQVCFNLIGRGPVTRWLLGPLLRRLCHMDTYHLRKHVLRHRPDQCRGLDLDTERPWLVRLHRIVAQPLRQLRRKVLVGCRVRSGRGEAHTELAPEDAVRREYRAAA